MGPSVGNRGALLKSNRLGLCVQVLCVVRNAITEARLRTEKLQNELGDFEVRKDLVPNGLAKRWIFMEPSFVEKPQSSIRTRATKREQCSTTE